MKGSDGSVGSQLADVNEFVSGAGGETAVVLPVHVQGGRLVVSKLLLYLEGEEVGGGRGKDEE